MGTLAGTVVGEAVTYDLMGNIKTLSRDGGNANLYVYSGNRLSYVEYLTLGYYYDDNGNATTDGRTGVTTAYNFLNLPVSATKAGLSLAYTYTAEGVKLRRTNSSTSTNHSNYL